MKEDRIFLIRLLMNTGKMVCSEYQGYFYRERADGACGSKRKVMDALRYMDEVKDIAAKYRGEIERLGSLSTFLRTTTWTPVNDVEELVFQGETGEWRVNRDVPARLAEFHKSGLLRLRHVRLRYVPAVACALAFGGMTGFLVNRKIGLLVRHLRRRWG